MDSERKLVSPSERLVSLDVFRGFTMMLLISGGFGIRYLADYPFWDFFATQVTHHEWNGLYAWDLIQPFFMFIVGVAMPFSFAKRRARGESWNSTFLHVLKRSVALFFLGVILHCSYSDKLVWELWNVLTQLSFTYLIAFLFIRKPIKTQLIISFAILLFNYLAYRFIPYPGAGDPWGKGVNLGSWIDMLTMGKINSGGWCFSNFVGSTPHTMWGVVAGLVLRDGRDHAYKIKWLVAAGIIGVVLGFALDPITPIVKRICTSSFIIVSGGWCFLALALFYWLIDVRGWRKGITFFLVGGMNPIFIYLYSNFLGGWTRNFVGIFTLPFLEPMGVAGKIIHQNLGFLAIWYLAWWLYKRKIVITI